MDLSTDWQWMQLSLNQVYNSGAAPVYGEKLEKLNVA